MALIPCPECGHQISTAARTCPNCGAPSLAARLGTIGWKLTLFVTLPIVLFAIVVLLTL